MGSLLSTKHQVHHVSPPDLADKVATLETKILLLVQMGQKYKQKIRDREREIERLEQSLLRRIRPSSNAGLSEGDSR